LSTQLSTARHSVFDFELEKAGGSWSCEDMTIVFLHAKVSRF